MPARAARHHAAVISAEAAGVLLLGSQGLLDDPAGAAGAKRLQHIVNRLGFVQIDSINAVERAHHLTLLARLEGYRPEMLATLLERDRHLFEQWTHDASAIPVAWYEHWHPRFERARRRIRANRWWRERMGARAGRIVRRVRDQVRSDGPLLARDVATPRGRGATIEGNGAWWGWRPEKAALEYLWRTGELAVAGRRRFEKVYDLSERVLADHHARPRPDDAAHRAWACSTALERLVVATPRELAAFWNAIDLASARRWCREAVASGHAVAVRVHGAGDNPARDAVALPDWPDRLAATPPAPALMRALSPFDPVVRDRDRLQRLFAFDYRFEAFVPSAKRVYGYYTLPLLEGARFVGRVSARTDRKRRVLVAEGVWWEPGVRPTRVRRYALEAALGRIARLAGADAVEL